MQLKQTYSNYYGQMDEEQKETLTEDPDIESEKAAHKHQLCLQDEQGTNQNPVTGR